MLRPLIQRMVCLATTGLWLASAVGHAWLLIARRGDLSLSQALALVLATVASLLLARLQRTMFRSPVWALIFTLLVVLAHAPGGLPMALAANAMIPLAHWGNAPRLHLRLTLHRLDLPSRRLAPVPIRPLGPRLTDIFPTVLSRPPPAAL